MGHPLSFVHNEEVSKPSIIGLFEYSATYKKGAIHSFSLKTNIITEVDYLFNNASDWMETSKKSLLCEERSSYTCSYLSWMTAMP